MLWWWVALKGLEGCMGMWPGFMHHWMMGLVGMVHLMVFFNHSGVVANCGSPMGHMVVICGNSNMVVVMWHWMVCRSHRLMVDRDRGMYRGMSTGMYRGMSRDSIMDR